MTYTGFKVLHMSALAVWLGGMLWQIWALGSAGAGSSTRKLDGFRRYDRFAALPAMALTWAFGLYLAFRGGWFGAHWLWLKLVFVLSLTAAYLIQRQAIRLAASPGAPPAGGGWPPHGGGVHVPAG